MNTVLKHTLVACIIFSLLISPLNAMAEATKKETDVFDDVSAAAMAADTVVVRPLGLVSLVTGLGLFIVSSPFSALGGNIGEAWGTMVATPAKFTFTRPLGEF